LPFRFVSLRAFPAATCWTFRWCVYFVTAFSGEKHPTGEISVISFPRNLFSCSLRQKKKIKQKWLKGMRYWPWHLFNWTAPDQSGSVFNTLAFGSTTSPVIGRKVHGLFAKSGISDSFSGHCIYKSYAMCAAALIHQARSLSAVGKAFGQRQLRLAHCQSFVP